MKTRIELSLELNPLIQERVANYRNLVQAEKGGLLRIFKERRQQVYEYWNKNGSDTSRVWLDRSRSSLDDWLSACPTSGQKEDAKRFCVEAYSLVEKHWKRVEEVGKAFEDKWSGVFYGALRPTTEDKLIDSVAWGRNAQSLNDLKIPELREAFVKSLEDVYEVSFSQPLSKLQAFVDSLPDEQKAQASQAVATIRQKIESDVRDRIKTLQKQIGDSLAWFQSSSIEQTFDRSELKGVIE